MSDQERLDFLTGMLTDAAGMIRDLAEEVSQYREIDREEAFLDEVYEATGKELT